MSHTLTPSGSSNSPAACMTAEEGKMFAAVVLIYNPGLAGELAALVKGRMIGSQANKCGKLIARRQT